MHIYKQPGGAVRLRLTFSFAMEQGAGSSEHAMTKRHEILFFHWSPPCCIVVSCMTGCDAFDMIGHFHKYKKKEMKRG